MSSFTYSISNHRRISSCLHPTYSINGHLLNTVAEVRDLGVIVDSSLKFDKHISLIVLKAQLSFVRLLL